MAPQVGFEPTTLRLTAGCSAIELLRNMVCFRTPYLDNKACPCCQAGRFSSKSSCNSTTTRTTPTPSRRTYTFSTGSNQGEATRVVFSANYTLKYGLLSQLLDIVIFHLMSRSMSTDILLSLKHYNETGKPIPPTVTQLLKLETALMPD
jgi:hypothetical protein